MVAFVHRNKHRVPIVGLIAARATTGRYNNQEEIMYRSVMTGAACAAVVIVPILSTAVAEDAAGFLETDLVANKQVLTDKNGVVHRPTFVDPNLRNPWGVGESSTSFFWVSDNASGKATLYNGQGEPQPRVVSIPSPADPLTASGAPTGVVFNTAQNQQAFEISGFTSGGKPTTAPALFLFATEDGTIVGWNPAVNPKGFDPAKAGTYGIIAVDNSTKPDPANGAVYKGLAIATDAAGATFLYATNFRSGKVEVYDANFAAMTSPPAFTDPKLPANYAPFNIVPVPGRRLVVTFAVQNADKHDDVAGQGHGVVDTFDLSGGSLQRLAQHGQLNSPWGVTLAPENFGEFGDALLIGNFGNGHINAFNLETGKFLGKLREPTGRTLVIDGLWALRVGNGGNGGDPDTVYFTAGPNGETDGLFGALSPNGRRKEARQE
jgi:uncharacterized protein (TIGR03118 family)